MMILSRSLITSLLVSVMAAGSALCAEPANKLVPGSTLTVQFPEMPPTFCAVRQKKDIKAQMTIFLPTNYDAGKKFPLLIFLNGGDGGTGRELGVARSLSEGKGFVCVSLPLFIKDLKENGGVIQDQDGAYMWPYFRTMLEKLLQVVPNIDTEHMILGGFSNGSHAVQGLINGSDGGIARRFSAFFVIEGGARPQRWYLLKGKPYLIVISQGKALDGMKVYCDTAKDAGVNATLICQDIGSHGIPEKAYPAMRSWLVGPAMAKARVSPGKSAAEEGAAPRQSAGDDNAGKGAAADTHKTFTELMKSADISEQGEGPMTFFAPTDAAFAALPKDQLDALKEDPKAARELLLNLMVQKDISPMNLPLAGKMKTLGGGILTASPPKATESDTGLLGLALVNDAKVLQRIPVSKGRRIYSLDKVVFAEKPTASEPSPATGKPAAPEVKLAPNTTFTLTFPDLPPTFDELGNPRDNHAMLMRLGGVPLVKGKCYQITFRIRSSELGRPVGVDIQDTNGWKHSGLNKAIRPGSDWTQGKFYFQNQNNMGDTARLDFSFLQTGHMDVADVQIVEIAAVPKDRNAPAEVVNPTNLVTNGDFSAVTNGVPTGWGTAGNKNNVDQVLTAEKDADGKPFARVTCTRLEHRGPGNKPMITVYLPKNYDTTRKFPLLVFLEGGTGGTGNQIGTPRALAQDKDFICVNMPLFKEAGAVQNQKDILIRDPDAKFAWSVYKKMLARLDETVPNIDPAHRIIGGFSNGAHTTKGLINQSEGEATTYFTAFYLVEGGGGLDRFDLLQGKPLFILYGAKNGGAWADRLCQAAIDAGAKAEVYGMPNTGHDFPAFVYPRFRAWLRGPALGSAALEPAQPAAATTGEKDTQPQKTAPPPPIQTVTTHPMKYYLSLPRNWSANRKWPVLVAPSAHYGDRGATLRMFARERDARRAEFIIVQPLVINADRVADMAEYRGKVADAISAADAATDGRDEVARGDFDREGVRAVIKDVQKLYQGQEKVYIAGFSSSTHIASMFVFTHPELLKGAVINSGGYAGRGVDEEHIPLVNSPERAKLEIKIIVGEEDRGYPFYTDNWEKTKAKLLRYGHAPAKLQLEVIKKGNPEKLNPGHSWYVTRIMDFCLAVEAGSQE